MRIKLINVKHFISAPKLLLPFIRDYMQKTVFDSVREKVGGGKKLFITEASPGCCWRVVRASGNPSILRPSCVLADCGGPC